MRYDSSNQQNLFLTDSSSELLLDRYGKATCDTTDLTKFMNFSTNSFERSYIPNVSTPRNLPIIMTSIFDDI